MTNEELTASINRLIPFEYAESWDRIGLQVGNPARTVTRVSLALDITAAAIAHAKSIGAELIISHHPPIFQPLSSLLLDRAEEALFHELIKSDLSVLALHTNLDAVPGGVADQFAALIGLKQTRTLAPLHMEQTTATLPDSRWSQTFQTVPGFGRTGNLQVPTLLSDLAANLRDRLSTPHLLIAATGDRRISCVTICPGSFNGDWIPLMEDQGSELLICGEIKYHNQLSLVSAGIAVIATGHDVSERIVLQPLSDLLSEQYLEIAFAVCPAFDYTKLAF